MKKNLISMVMMLTAVSASAQEVKVAEPEFINSYCIVRYAAQGVWGYW